MENFKKNCAGFSPMNPEEQASFDQMINDMQVQMEDLRLNSISMSREAETASAMAYLNC